jgi:hypothetical protein
MNKQTFSFTTDASGDATSGQSTSTAQASIFGKLVAIDYLPGNTDTGATVTVTCVGDITKALLTKASAGTANTRFYPRDLVNGVADGAALTGTSGGDRTQPLLTGKIKVVIASGGDTKTGSVVIYYE